jgi:hypothetical protein
VARAIASRSQGWEAGASSAVRSQAEPWERGASDQLDGCLIDHRKPQRPFDSYRRVLERISPECPAAPD